jgi:spore coat protein H
MMNSRRLRRRARVLVLTLGALAAGSRGDSAYGQSAAAASRAETRDLFSVDKPLAVALTVAQENWNLLRSEGRRLPDVLAGCAIPDFPYTFVPSEVSIDGETVADVAVRKKGFLGSLSTQRPSLRLDFGRGAHDGRTFHGTRRITLNNNQQDRTNAKQCVVYELFAAAGLPAPRCGLARVTVNGEDKGAFTNVEPIDKPFLRRAFGNDGGNLYELTLGDFTPERKVGLELKTNESRNDRSDLDRVERALAAPDDKLAEALDVVFDLDEFLTFWAMEVLTGHWDGMTGNRNNTFIYHDQADDRFHPIPWGTDGTFTFHPFVPDAPASVYAYNSLSQRLYGVPALRQRYHARLRELLGRVWNEDRIVSSLRRLTELTDGSRAGLAAAEAFVRGRRQAVEQELASNAGRGPEVGGQPFALTVCRQPAAANGTIDFTWNDVALAFQPVADPAAVEFDIPLPGGPIQFAQVTQLATINAEGQVQLGLAGLDTNRKAPVFVGLMMPPELYKVGDVTFHGTETMGVVVQIGGVGVGQPLALIGGGSVTLTEVSRENGGRVRGHWKGFVAPLPQPEP